MHGANCNRPLRPAVAPSTSSAGDDGPPPEIPNPPPSDADRAVAQLIAAEVEDGSCLQVGIGAMPNAVCSLLRESGVRDLGVHTEMLTDGIAELYRAGVVTGACKTLQPGKVVCTFGVGTKPMADARAASCST